MDELRKAARGCSRCDQDEAEGGVVSHCDACCRRITTIVCGMRDDAQVRATFDHAAVQRIHNRRNEHALDRTKDGPEEPWLRYDECTAILGILTALDAEPVVEPTLLQRHIAAAAAECIPEPAAESATDAMTQTALDCADIADWQARMDMMQMEHETALAQARAEEREACAKLCEVAADAWIDDEHPSDPLECAAAIRARGRDDG